MELKYDIIHEDRRGITFWVDRHNQYATLEALEQLKTAKYVNKTTNPSSNSQIEKKRLFKKLIWKYLPPILRPFLYFFYRDILRLGFLDGKAGFICHFLHGLWYPLLVDIKLKEMQKG